MEKQQTFEEFLKNLSTEFSIVYLDKVPTDISNYVTYNDTLVVADENLDLELAVLGHSVGSNGEGHYCRIINQKKQLTQEQLTKFINNLQALPIYPELIGDDYKLSKDETAEEFMSRAKNGDGEQYTWLSLPDFENIHFIGWYDEDETKGFMFVSDTIDLATIYQAITM